MLKRAVTLRHCDCCRILFTHLDRQKGNLLRSSTVHALTPNACQQSHRTVCGSKIGHCRRSFAAKRLAGDDLIIVTATINIHPHTRNSYSTITHTVDHRTLSLALAIQPHGPTKIISHHKSLALISAYVLRITSCRQRRTYQTHRSTYHSCLP